MSTDISRAWDELKRRVSECQKCGLCKKRHNTVFGEGPEVNCRVVIVGEGPGADEDALGRPFVGKAGQLLTGILENSTSLTSSNADRPRTEILPARKLLHVMNFLRLNYFFCTPT